MSAGIPTGPGVPAWDPPATYLERLEVVEALLESLQGAAATTDELSPPVLFSSNVSVSQSMPVWVAPFACEITSARVVVWGTGGAIGVSSDVNYWTVELRRLRAAAVAAIATKDTRATGGEAFASRVDWNFDGAAFSASNKVFQAGDIAALAFTITGTPGALNLPVLLQVAYRPT
jgi:hypothetical protein